MKWLFLPVLAGKPWNGNTVLSESLGGSEAAVAYIASALSKAGNDVTVVTHGQPMIDYSGVRYLNAEQGGYNGVFADKWDVVVSSRWPQVLEEDWKTKAAFLWLHDMPSQAFSVRANSVVFVSHTQKAAYGLPEDFRAEVIYNGVDGDLIKNVNRASGRDENVLMWISNPDRGLAIAAHIFQEIRARWPAMELHVYGRSAVYGWDDAVESPYLPRMSDMEGVKLFAPLPRAQLLSKLSGALALFYPTYWPETFCMSALEAQAVGTPVIASPVAALNETVKGGILTWDFLNAVSQLRNAHRWEKLCVQGIEFASEHTWTNKAKEWMALASKYVL